MKKKRRIRITEEVDRLPRQLLRNNVSDMQVGESGWVSHFHIRVAADGRVGLDTKANCLLQMGKDPESRMNGDHLITRLENGYQMTVFQDTTFNTGPYIEFEQWLEETAGAVVIRKLTYPINIEPCPVCCGSGFTKCQKETDGKRKHKRRAKHH